jgi:phosphate transport system substrate-binding protein
MKRVLVAVALLGLGTGLVKGQPPAREPLVGEAIHARLDPGLPVYRPSRPVPGEIRGVSEDTMEALVNLWKDAFLKIHPEVRFEVAAKGSSTVAPAITKGTADIGIIGRNWLPKDLATFEQKYGHEPFAVRVGSASYRNPDKIRAVAFFVHKTNPIHKLSLAQIDAIFSKTRKRGYKEDITTWGQLGLKGEWAKKPITLHGIKRPSGLLEYLEDRVLEGGEFKDGIKVYASAGSVKALDLIVGGVAEDPGGIGYARFGETNPNVKAVALAENDGGPYYKGTFDNVVSHRYPLSRFIYVFVNRPPDKPIDPKVKEFLKFLLSKQGQQTLQKEGDFLPLPAPIVREERAKLE